MWLDYIEALEEFPYMAYFCVLRDMKCNEMILLGKGDKLEML